MAVQKRNMGTASANLITRQSINDEELVCNFSLAKKSTVICLIQLSSTCVERVLSEPNILPLKYDWFKL